MSITAVKPYFQARAKAVGLKEHTDGFNEDNIPSTLISGSFHILLGDFAGKKLNQADLEVECPVTLKFWLNGYRTPADGIDKAVQKGDELIKECLKNSNRLGTIIKNVSFGRMATEAITTTNDNVIKVTCTFTALVSVTIS